MLTPHAKLKNTNTEDISVDVIAERPSTAMQSSDKPHDIGNKREFDGEDAVIKGT